MFPKYKIVNVVTTATLDQEIDFEAIRKLDNVFHDSDVYGGRAAYFKTNEMQGKVSIFSSGKMISVGTKTREESFRELEEAKDFLVKSGFITEVSIEPKIRNLVISVDFGKTINLEDLVYVYQIIYEPEQFPGGILRLSEPFKASVLIFSTGKVIITGLKAMNQIEKTIAHLKKCLIT
ncbi:MAG: hypothetical protein NUK63_03270 [Candidatus Bathyarchaeum tardum]|nr:MAG: hypothetical protein NUK63_03270 [Candidatus Bathyarchaeum tardum]